MIFGFDERYSMFGATPVENQFILEFLPAAKGEYVKVYLYGLLRCHYPEESMNLDRMCHELGMTEEEVLNAYRYWERRRVVRRISDHPPAWQYVNIQQTNLAGAEDPDPEYTAFSEAIYESFNKGRRLHGSELAQCFEWHEGLKLPMEVILMLLNHMVELKGKNFNFQDAEKVAAQMADEKILNVEDAEAFFSRDRQTWQEVKRILRKLGKRYMPSEAQMQMYRKWVKEWKIPPEVIDQVIEMSARGDPTMGYMDNLLNGMRQDAGAGGTVELRRIEENKALRESLRAVLKTLGRGDVNPQTLEMYQRMAALYPQEIILLAARECGGAPGKTPADVLMLLQAWKDRGFEKEEQIKAYIQAFHDQTALLKELHRIWGTDENKIGRGEREMALRWEKELGFPREMILQTAPLAAEARAPLSYLDKILTEYAEKGIRTPEAAAKERADRAARGEGKPTSPAGKGNAQNSYQQRDYSGEQDEAMRQFIRMNGGDPDA